MNQEIYQDINWEEVIPKWEEIIATNPNANKLGSFLRDLLPFVKKTKPKISKVQSLFGNLTLICLEGPVSSISDEDIIDEGLEPLLKSRVLEIREAHKFLKWFRGHDDKPYKKFSLEGVGYELIVDNYPANYRDLLLKINGDTGGEGYPIYCLTTGCTGFGEDGYCHSEGKCTWVRNQTKKE